MAASKDCWLCWLFSSLSLLLWVERARHAVAGAFIARRTPSPGESHRFAFSMMSLAARARVDAGGEPGVWNAVAESCGLGERRAPDDAEDVAWACACWQAA